MRISETQLRKIVKRSMLLQETKSTWVGKLGTERRRGCNFHMTADDNNNFRGGIREEDTEITPELFKGLYDAYGVERVVTLNAGRGGKTIPDKITDIEGNESGQIIEPIYLPTSDSNDEIRTTRSELDIIFAALDKGGTLVHCAHGGDRTAAIMGRYYVEMGFMTADEAVLDGYRYKGGCKAWDKYTVASWVEAGRPKCPKFLKSVEKFIRQGPSR